MAPAMMPALLGAEQHKEEKVRRAGNHGNDVITTKIKTKNNSLMKTEKSNNHQYRSSNCPPKCYFSGV